MANIVRCEMPDKTHRFSPFKISDYRDFLLIRNDMNNHDLEKQEEILNDILDDYFPNYPKTWQQYFFLKVYTSSIGNTKIDIVYQCPHCGKKIPHIFNIAQDPLKNPTIKISDDTTLLLKFPEDDTDDLSQHILNNIEFVDHKGVRYDWTKLDDETKESLYEAISLADISGLTKSMKPIHFALKTKRCCGHSQDVVYSDLLSMFKLLVNPEEIFTFYEINHILLKHNYDLAAILSMYPIERTIALTNVEKEKAKERAQK